MLPIMKLWDSSVWKKGSMDIFVWFIIHLFCIYLLSSRSCKQKSFTKNQSSVCMEFLFFYFLTYWIYFRSRFRNITFFFMGISRGFFFLKKKKSKEKYTFLCFSFFLFSYFHFFFFFILFGILNVTPGFFFPVGNTCEIISRGISGFTWGKGIFSWKKKKWRKGFLFFGLNFVNREKWIVVLWVLFYWNFTGS